MVVIFPTLIKKDHFLIYLQTHLIQDSANIKVPELSNPGAVAGEAVLAFFAGGPSVMVTRPSAMATMRSWRTGHQTREMTD